MYAEFFGLRELPFNNTPDPRFFYSTPDHEEALASLIYSVKEKKGFVLLTGEVGAGKTLVSRLMIKHFAGTIAFANLNHAIKDSGDLIESLCAEFELPHDKKASNAQLVRTLHDFLLAKFAQNTPVVVVLDEAQNLSVEGFEQLRMIGNLEADDAKLLQIAIVGQPELQTMFQSNALRQLRQRLFRSFHLPALDRNAVDGYIRHRLQVAGARDPVMFGSRSIDAIHKASRGLPRLINTLCDNIMLSAYSADRKKLDTTFVENVLASLVPHEPTPDAVSHGVSHRSTPARNYSDAGHQEYMHQQQPLSAVCDHATALVAQLEAHTRQGGAVADRLAAGTERCAQLQHQLLQREKQFDTLHHTVKSSAAQIAPLLDKMNAATREGIKCTENAQAVMQRLADQTVKSQSTLERMTNALHEMRIAQINTQSASPSTYPASVGSKIVPEARIRATVSAVTSPKPETGKGVRVARTTTPPPEQGELIHEPGRPALRLARRMENLAALVHQAVSVCSPLVREPGPTEAVGS